MPQQSGTSKMQGKQSEKPTEQQHTEDPTAPPSETPIAPAPSPEDEQEKGNDSEEEEEASVYPVIPDSHFTSDLTSLGDPIYDKPKESKGLLHMYYSTQRIPGLFGARHFRYSHKALAEMQRITQALQYAEDYRTNNDSALQRLSRSDERKWRVNEAKPLVQKGIDIINAIFVRFEVLHDTSTGQVHAARPANEIFKQASERLEKLWKKAQIDMTEESKAGIEPPQWGEDNEYAKWRSLNDFEIIATAYRQDADEFMY